MPPSKSFDRSFLFTSFANYPLSFMSTTTAKKKTFGSLFPSCPRQFWISRHLSNLWATSLPGFSAEGERKRENPGREVGLSGELVLSRSIPSLLNHLDQARTALGTRLYRRFYSDKSSTPACPLFWVKDQNVNDIVDGGWRYSWTPL